MTCHKKSLGSVWKKLNLTQQKHTFTNQNKFTTAQNKHKKLKPGLVASHDIRPGNREDIFWHWCFINLSLTYLDTYGTHLLTVPDPHGALNLDNLVDSRAEVTVRTTTISV